MITYRAYVKIPDVDEFYVDVPDIATAKEGFWINRDKEICNVLDELWCFIPAGSVRQVLRLVDGEVNHEPIQKYPLSIEPPVDTIIQIHTNASESD